MVDLSAPDGANEPINNTTAQYLQTIPGYTPAFLSCQCESAWEQAAIIYLDGARQPTQLGNYSRPGVLWIGQTPQPRSLMVTGWHKRSGPDGGQRWHASQGDAASPTLVRWDDSGGDRDFNDLTVGLQLLGGLHPAVRAEQPAIVRGEALRDADDDIIRLAEFLVSTSALHHALAEHSGEDEAAGLDDLNETQLIDAFMAASPPSVPVDHSRADALARELALRAQLILDGPLREHTQRLAAQAWMLARVPPTGDAEPASSARSGSDPSSRP
jgi:hypothetical protein